jgi:uncharacterized repeat protein (TIGR03803 family)
MRSKKAFPASKPTFVIFMTLLLASAVVPTEAQAQKFNVLHTFHGRDGGGPEGVLVRDTAGNSYGTAGGGTGKCSKFGCGTVFKLDRAGNEVWLHSFGGWNGRQPMAGLLRDAAGNLYGTTIYGGKMTQACGGAQGFGCGVVFKLDKSGKETVLYKFKGMPDGYFSEALLAKDKTGSLYGTTYPGGADGWGTVFKVDIAGKETVLHNFAGPPNGGGDGAIPGPGVSRDAAGNIYGVTGAGGAYGAGTVFKLDATGKENLLYSFTGGADGGGPGSVLLLAKGNIYGTTGNGGNSECGGSGCGVVFGLSPQSDGSWTESVLYTFCSLPSCADGERPLAGPLVRDSVGNLYGTTYFGGASDDGIVFKLDTTGKETVLHSFTGGADGAFPYAGLIMDSHGNLYGTTQGGGATCYTSFTCGVVFEIIP